MNKYLINWRTTLAGAATLFTTLAHLATTLSTGDATLQSCLADLTAVLIAIGLVAAKDAP